MTDLEKWKLTSGVPGPPRPAPVAHLKLPKLVLKKIMFEQHAAAIFKNASTHDIVDRGVTLKTLKDLDSWGRGDEITEEEWVAARSIQFPACVLKRKPVDLKVTLGWQGPAAISAKLSVTPTLDGDTTKLLAATVTVSVAAGAAEHVVAIQLGGKMPGEVGRFKLVLKWSAIDLGPGSNFEFDDVETEHFVFCRFDEPLLPAFDSKHEDSPGKKTGDGSTHTGTPKRLDQLMKLIDRVKRRHAARTDDDIEEILWNIHIALNDSPRPPYFDAIHDEHLTHNGDQAKFFDPSAHLVIGTGIPLALDDQWLMWVTTSAPHWNTASCIGHVQLIKTMVAAIGIFVRRAWVLPKTERMPDGTTVKLTEQDLYCLGNFDEATQQSWTFTHDGRVFLAKVRLMEPDKGYENFEACLRTPGGKLLPGGYSSAGVAKDAPSFITDHGFASALDVLTWWTSTSRGSFHRFMCWLAVGDDKVATHCWDRDGKHYDIKDFKKIFDTGKHLLPPKKPKSGGGIFL